MISSVALQAVIALAATCLGDPDLVACGGSDAQGCLINLSCGAGPCDPVEPDKPTIVVTHGFNPFPRRVRFCFPESFAREFRYRCGTGVNVLAWDWNADTFVSLRPKVNSENAIDQGCRLATALISRGVEPAHTQLIGHSLGCVVVVSAARHLASTTGEPIAQLTLLDPLKSQHALIFERLAATRVALRVENDWAPGLSGYGAQANYPGVINVRVPGATPLRGLVNPLLSNHLHVVRWRLNALRLN
jgi:pimeloyl-ACP methyl ester carboxylesterase